MSVPVADLVARFGSPLYVYDLDVLAQAQRDLVAALPPGVRIYYSLKANPHPLIARTLRETEWPCHAEVCSGGELASALEAGYPADEILYGGPGKTVPELDAAIGRGVQHFSVESLSDLRHVGLAAVREGVTVECVLRLNAADAAAATSIRMTGVASQFGLDVETVPAIADELRSVPGIRLVGLHVYPLSNSRDEQSLIAEFCNSIEITAAVRDELGLPVELLDLGGGFAAPYAQVGRRPVYDKVADELAAALDLGHCGWRHGRPQVAVESGRYLAGDCGRLVTSVTNVKHSRGARYLIMDAGVNTFGGMAGLGRMLPVAVELADGSGGERGVATSPAHLAGPLCTPGDLLARNVAVAELAPGDLVVVPNAGAYGATASLVSFLSRAQPVEVFVRDDEVVAATRNETRRTEIEV